MTTNPTKILITIAFALLLLTTTPTSAKAISSGRELVRPQRHETQKQNLTAAKKTTTTSNPLPAADKIWTIGALLPMTGEYAAIGQRFHRGLKLALTAAPAPNHHKWQLILLDSAKIPPATAIKQLKDNHATVILGPIQSKLAQPAAKEAIACRLPIILMAPQPRLTRLNENVFQHFLSAANQAREMARFLQQKDEKKVSLIHPDNDFGNDFKKPSQIHAGTKKSLSSKAAPTTPTKPTSAQPSKFCKTRPTPQPSPRQPSQATRSPPWLSPISTPACDFSLPNSRFTI